MPCDQAAATLAAQRLAVLQGNEQLTWLCQSQGNDTTPGFLVTGWAGLVRQLAMDCIDFAAPPQALTQAEAWLIEGAGDWYFEPNGSASWRIILPDGAWSATLLEGRW